MFYLKDAYLENVGSSVPTFDGKGCVPFRAPRSSTFSSQNV